MSAPTEDKLKLDQILPGDNVEVLAREFPDKSVDLIFADPPYNLQLGGNLYRPNMTKVNGVDDEWDQFDNFEAYDDYTQLWLSECRRVLKDTGTIWVIGTYHDIHRVGRIMMDLGYWLINDVVWIKTNPMPQFNGVRFTNAHETLIWATKSKDQRYTFHYHAMKNLNHAMKNLTDDDSKQMRSDWEIPICSGTERVRVNGEKAHTTQKPEALLYRVISSSSKPGDIVLDPFFGTGTTGVVAKKLHRHWIGIERDEKYIHIAQERIDAVMPSPFDEVLYTTRSKRDAPRIPFGNLLEAGLLQPGDTLYLDKTKATAKVLADGTLQAGDIVGTIHRVGAKLLDLPALNGWDHWYYQDKESGDFVVIDRLREKIRMA